jgi:hypothetical protein
MSFIHSKLRNGLGSKKVKRLIYIKCNTPQLLDGSDAGVDWEGSDGEAEEGASGPSTTMTAQRYTWVRTETSTCLLFSGVWQMNSGWCLYQAVYFTTTRALNETESTKVKRYVQAMGFCTLARMKVRFAAQKTGDELHSPSEAKEKNNFIVSIPYSLRGKFEDFDLTVRLFDIDRRLREYFLSGKSSKTKKHNGVSLGYTALSGGDEADANAIPKVSGTYQAQQEHTLRL